MQLRLGAPVFVREIHLGRVYSVRPGWVAGGDEQHGLLYFGAGTQCLWPCDRSGRGLRVPADDWQLRWGSWLGASQLHHVQPGAGHTVSLLWRGAERSFAGYKVDFHSPLRASALGFEMLDWALDLMIAPDGSHRVKDVDEFARMREHGLLSDRQAEQVSSLSEEVLADARACRGPFSPEWLAWAPDPAWNAAPSLPAGWDVV